MGSFLCGVLAANGGRCPLSDLAARYTDERASNFDIYLPNRPTTAATISTCRILTLENSGKIYRSLRSPQELTQQELMRVRFACFGLSVLETNSFPSPRTIKESAPDSIESRDASPEQPSLRKLLTITVCLDTYLGNGSNELRSALLG